MSAFRVWLGETVPVRRYVALLFVISVACSLVARVLEWWIA